MTVGAPGTLAGATSATIGPDGAASGPAGVAAAGLPPMSSGAPAVSGALGGVEPSGRGAPGALGSALGSKASPRRGLTPGASSVAGRGGDDRRRRADRRGGSDGRCAGRGRGRAAEAVFDVLLEALELVLQQALLVLQLFDAAVGLSELVLEPVEPDHHLSGIVGIAGVGADAGDHRRRRRLRRLGGRSDVERIEVEGPGAARAGDADGEEDHAGAAKAGKGRHDVKPLSGPTGSRRMRAGPPIA